VPVIRASPSRSTYGHQFPEADAMAAAKLDGVRLMKQEAAVNR